MIFDNLDLNILLFLCENGDRGYTIYDIAKATEGVSKKAESKIRYRLDRLSEREITVEELIEGKKTYHINDEKVYYYDDYEVDLGFKKIDYGKTIVFDLDNNTIICHLERDV